MKKFKPGVYKHYKGGLYFALTLARHSETLDYLVVYTCLYENKDSQVWVRPLAMFLEDVTVDGKKMPRFKFLREG